MLIHSTKKS